MSEQNQPVPEYKEPSQIDPLELAKAFVEDGVINEVPANLQEKALVAPAQAEVKAPIAEAKPPAEELPALLRIAKERDAFRKEQEQVKPYLELLKAFPAHNAQAVAKAVQMGDPVGAMTALGFTHAQYNAALLGVKGRQEAPPEEKPSGNPDIDSLKQEIQALRQEREAEKVAASRTGVMSQMKDILKDSPKFEHINKLEDFDGVEKVLIEYHRQHGELPGTTFAESVQLAAEHYESQLRKEAQRWAKVLTPGTVPASVPSKATEAPRGHEQARTLTNANTTAPAAPRASPKTREEVIQAILEGREVELET